MKKNILTLTFFLNLTLFGQKMETPEAWETACECLEKEQKITEKKLEDCISAADLTSQLFQMLPETKEIEAAINSGKDTIKQKENITIRVGQNRVEIINELEKNCSVFQKYVQESYEPLAFKNKDIKKLSKKYCECFDEISSKNISRMEIKEETAKCISKEIEEFLIEQKEYFSYTHFSKDYNNLEYEIQTYTLENCKEIKDLLVEDKVGDYSYSTNQKANDLYLEGTDLMNAGKYEKAIPKFEKALKIDPMFAFAYDHLAICHRRLNQFDKAIENYKKSLMLDEKSPIPLINLGVAYGLSGDYENAKKTYEKYISYYPDDAEGYYGVSRIYGALEEDEKALENALKALKIYRDTNSPYEADAEKLVPMFYQSLVKKGKEDEAKKIVKSQGFELE